LLVATALGPEIISNHQLSTPAKKSRILIANFSVVAKYNISMHNLTEEAMYYTVTILLQVQPNPKEYDAIVRLISRRERSFACSLRDASQPLLQLLALDICYGK